MPHDNVGGMLILMDVDGPVASFDPHLHTRASTEGWKLDINNYDEQIHRYLTDHVPDRGHRSAMRAVVDGPGWFRELPVTPGAEEGIDAMLVARHEVWFVTKPLDSSPTCADEKRAWVTEHFPAMTKRLIIAPDKSLIHGDVLVDDAPKVEWFGRARWCPVIFTAPYNGPGSRLASYHHWTWADGIRALEDLVRVW